MRLAFFLVLSLVGIGVARGDFASGEARSEDAGPLMDRLTPPDSSGLVPDSTQAPGASGVDVLIGRIREAVAPEAR